MTLNVAFQMDPLETINIDTDSSFMMALEALRRGHRLFHYQPKQLVLEGNQLSATVRPFTVVRERGNHFTAGADRPVEAGPSDDAPGPALRHGLYHRDPPAAAYPAGHIGAERPGRGAQRAGETVRHAFPGFHAADLDHKRQGGGAGIPRQAPGHHREAAVRQWRGRRLSCEAGRRKSGLAAGDL